MRCRFTSKAETELQDALNYYQASGADLGVEFLAEVEATVRRIVANPTAWAPMSARTSLDISQLGWRAPVPSH